jgi:hypothetical protein
MAVPAMAVYTSAFPRKYPMAARATLHFSWNHCEMKAAADRLVLSWHGLTAPMRPSMRAVARLKLKLMLSRFRGRANQSVRAFSTW